ncbi:MAG: ABC transporter substrate-binding protein [Lachnospiraceae bacterium]|nr:ABC transporter substrate-binding protein [Lachnospiraceae bacterium]
MKKLIALLLSVAMVLSLAACSNQSQSSEKAPDTTAQSEKESQSGKESEPAPASKYGGVLHVAQPTMDYTVAMGCPFSITGTEQQTAMEALYDALWRRGADGNIELVLADSYSVSDDGLEYTFKLKDGIKFHDGSDLNAEVVAWNYAKIVETGSITGLESAEAVDANTVKIRLSINNPFFLMANSQKQQWYICSKENYDKNGEDYAMTHPVGTGAFKFVSMEVNKSIVLEKNENYWQKDSDGNALPYLDGVEITAISDPTVASAALSNGEIDVYAGTLADMKLNLETYGLDNFIIDKGSIPTKASGIRFMANNRNAKLFTDERLRKAVAYAIDGEAVAASFADGNMIATDQIAPAGSPDYVANPTTYGYDPEKAKELLKEAGYPNGFEIEINIDQTATSQRLAELYQYYLGEVGITVKIMSYANAERNEIQDRDDTWDQLLVSGTGINGDAANVWSNCSPTRKKWANMQPFESEPEWVALWNKVSECVKIDDAYKALAEYWAYAYDHCCTYLFMHEYPDIKYYNKNIDPQLDKIGIRWLDPKFVYFNNK